MARAWTPAQRAKQSEIIHGWKPWQNSTGARTPEGKAKASQNRRKSLEAAEAELLAAMAKVQRLRGG